MLLAVIVLILLFLLNLLVIGLRLRDPRFIQIYEKGIYDLRLKRFYPFDNVDDCFYYIPYEEKHFSRGPTPYGYLKFSYMGKNVRINHYDEELNNNLDKFKKILEDYSKKDVIVEKMRNFL